MTDTLCILVCENTAPEAVAVTAGEGFEDVIVRAFPARCGRPMLAWEELSTAVGEPGTDVGRVVVLGGACCRGLAGTPGPDRPRFCVNVAEHCPQLLVSTTTAASLQQGGAFLLSPGWLTHWRQHMEVWGFDQETARDFFGECTDRLLLLDSGVVEGATAMLHELADFVGLTAEVLPVGLELMRLQLSNLVLEWRLERAAQAPETDRQTAELAMAMDLVVELAAAETEAEAIERICALFSMLFSPRRVVYLPIVDGEPTLALAASQIDLEAREQLAGLSSAHEWTPSGDGFLLRIDQRGVTVSVALIDGLTFPEHKERYLNLALGLSRVCGLSVANARSYEAIRAAEQQARQYADELKQCNAELDAFAYSVSHDLRAPLRGIDGFSRVLLDRYGASLEGTAQDYLQRIRAATQRMGTLIDDLLQLSRLSRAELRSQRIDLTAMAQAIAADLAAAEPGRQVTWEIAEGFDAVGDPTLVRAALENLLGNAWKYTGHNAVARIELGSLAHEGGVAFFVRDDGAGFDMAYAAKLFGAFQRLHGADEFPGTGIGLASVQRIVHRHGGRVWAEAEVGRGATFYFTLAPPLSRSEDGARR